MQAYEIPNRCSNSSLRLSRPRSFEQGGMGGGGGYARQGDFRRHLRWCVWRYLLAAVVVAEVKRVHNVGSDLRYNMSFLEEALFVVYLKKLKYQHLLECDICDGSGAKAPSHKRGTCQRPFIMVQMRQGFFAVQQTCPTCNGKKARSSKTHSATHAAVKVANRRRKRCNAPRSQQVLIPAIAFVYRAKAKQVRARRSSWRLVRTSTRKRAQHLWAWRQQSLLWSAS